MSQGFKFKYAEMQASNPASTEKEAQEEKYKTASYVRNVCFIWPNGYRVFLNYSYLIAGEFLPEENKIVLSFTTHILTLTGIRLERLYTQLMHHIPMHIDCTDERYNAASNPDAAIVNDILMRSPD